MTDKILFNCVTAGCKSPTEYMLEKSQNSCCCNCSKYLYSKMNPQKFVAHEEVLESIEAAKELIGYTKTNYSAYCENNDLHGLGETIKNYEECLGRLETKFKSAIFSPRMPTLIEVDAQAKRLRLSFQDHPSYKDFLQYKENVTMQIMRHSDEESKQISDQFVEDHYVNQLGKLKELHLLKVDELTNICKKETDAASDLAKENDKLRQEIEDFKNKDLADEELRKKDPRVNKLNLPRISVRSFVNVFRDCFDSKVEMNSNADLELDLKDAK